MELVSNIDKNKDGSIDIDELSFQVSSLDEATLQSLGNEIKLSSESQIIKSLLESIDVLLKKSDNGEIVLENSTREKLLKLREKFNVNLDEDFLSNEFINGLKNELTPDIAQQINDLTKKIVDHNGLKKNNAFFLVMDTIAGNLGNFPHLQKLFLCVGEIATNKGLDDMSVVDLRMNKILGPLLKSGYFISGGFVEGGGNLLIPVSGERTPSKELDNIFSTSDYSNNITYVIDDKGFKSQGSNNAGYSFINIGGINSLLENSVKNGRFSQEQVNGFNVDNIAQATINHETAHNVLDDVYNFKARQDIDKSKRNEWMIDGLNFVPTDTIHIHEFIAHSMGQATDKYEIITNIGNAIADLSQDSYKINGNGDYALLRSFILKELSDIFRERGAKDFEEEFVNLWKDINKERNELISKIQELDKSGDKEGKKRLIDNWNNTGIIEYNKKYGNFTNRVISALSQDDYDRINRDCIKQSKIYMEKIKNEYGYNNH